MNLAFALPGALFVGFSLGIFGSGGSILTVPILVYVLGQDEKVAIASSLAIVGLVALFGSIPYIREKLVDWRTVVLFGVPGIVGTWLGAIMAGHVSGTVQLLTFAIVMLVAAAFMLNIVKLPVHKTADLPQSVLKITIEGLVVGALTGFVGVGGGFLIVPALVLLGGLSMQTAIASSLVIITLKSSAGIIKYLDVLAVQGLQVDWLVIGFFAAAGIVGSFAGTQVATRLPQEALQKAFGFFLVVMGVFIIVKNLNF